MVSALQMHFSHYSLLGMLFTSLNSNMAKKGIMAFKYQDMGCLYLLDGLQRC